MSLKLLPLLLLGFLAATPPAAAQGEKGLYKMGLLLADDDKRHGGDVLNAATDAFVAARRFTMVERKQLNAVFTEKDLQEFIGGKVNNKLSDVLGLDLLGVVDFTVETTRPPGKEAKTTWIIDVRLVDVKTAAILATVTSNRPTLLLPSSTPREAGELLFKSIREAFPPMGYVIQVDGKEVIIDLGNDAGLKKGDDLEVVQEGDQIIHPVSGQVMTGPMKVIGQLTVVSSSAQLSTCKLKSKGVAPLASMVRLKGSNSLIVKWLLALPRLKKEFEEKKEELKS
jgi:hypothetical protein